MMKYVFFKALSLLLITTFLAACTSRTVTLDSDRKGSYSSFREDSFGICYPLLNRRELIGFYLWNEFLRQLALPNPRTISIAGYEVGTNRGQSCHLRSLNTLQATTWFDLSALPSTLVTRAELRITSYFSPLDPTVDRGSREECLGIRIGEATEDWLSGVTTRRAPINWRPGRRDSGPYVARGAIRTYNVDVTDIVTLWAIGSRPNFGFVVSPDMPLVLDIYNRTEDGHFMCDFGISSTELIVTVRVREDS